MFRPLIRLSAAYGRAYDTNPVITATVTAGGLAGLGDIIAQRFIEKRDRVNWRRCFSIGSASAIYAAVIYVPFLRWAQRFGSGTAKAVLTQMSLDVFLLTPIVYVPMFYYWTEMVRGSSFKTAHEMLVSKYWESVVPCLAVWAPAQTLNFWLVPINYRILFIYSVELLWAVMISVISTRGSASVEAADATKSTVTVVEVEADAAPAVTETREE